MAEKKINDIGKKKFELEAKILKLCKEYAKIQLDIKYIISKKELERDGIIFGDKDFLNKVVTEIRIRQWKDDK